MADRLPHDSLVNWPYCFYCDEPIAGPTERTPPTAYMCKPCHKARKPLTDKARYLVMRAIAKGDLPWIEFMKCYDCNRQAHVYEHRDYNRPLDVDPVCRSCNKLRGPATWDCAKETTLQSRLIEKYRKQKEELWLKKTGNVPVSAR